MTVESDRVAGYEGVTTGVGILEGPGTAVLEVSGSAAAQMLQGVVSGRIPSPPTLVVTDLLQGDAPYSTLLTSKGKMVTDLRLVRLSEEEFLLALPEAGWEGALAHLGKFLNPRFGRLTERREAFGSILLVGPKVPDLLRAFSEDRGVGPWILPESDGCLFQGGERFPDLLLLDTPSFGFPAVELLAPPGALEELRDRALELGAELLPEAVGEILRLEAGVPRFGVDMTEETIPLEAGIHPRAIDQQKGCYIGQEVIVRLRDRGRVNKRLVRFHLGREDAPPSGTELCNAETGKARGWVTSACDSPRFGETIALGYVRRGVEEGAYLRLGGPDGPALQVGADVGTPTPSL